MALSIDHAGSRDQRSSALPPWLWFWLAFYILGLPPIFDRVKVDLLILFTGRDGTNPITYSILERVPSVVEVLLDLALFTGVLTVLLPRIRTVFLQRKYGLTEPQFLPPATPQETLQTLSQINEFIREHAPGLTLTYNAGGKVLSDKAFIYPIGYRRAGLALSGQLLALWNKEREAAEAILLHEIEHYRHGDMFVIGAGSLLEAVIRRWLLLTAIFVVIPLAASLLIGHITSFQEEMHIVADLPTILSFHIRQFFTMDIPFLVLICFQSFFWAASLFTIVVMAIWCTEINADRFVVDTTQSTSALVKAMEQHAAPTSRWRWLLTGAHHPPAALRRWLALRSKGTKGLTFLLLLFPAAWFIRLLFLCGWALSQYLVFLYSGTSPGYIIGELGIDTEYFIEALVPTWIAIAVLIALWPVLRRYWERIFAHTAGVPARSGYAAYLSSTGFVAFVCVIGLLLSLLPAPGEPSGLTPVTPYATSTRPSGHFVVGQTVKIGNAWIITVRDAQEKPGNGLLPASPGHAYVAIDVVLKNISSETAHLADDLQFSLRDLQGVKYDETYIASPLPPAAAQYGNVPAGTTVQGRLDYEVPVSVAQFTLSFKVDWTNPDPSQVTVWDIAVSPIAPTGSPTTTPTLVPTPSASASTGSYPALQQAYTGVLVNTTDSSNTSADAMLSSIVQVNGEIVGNMTVQAPLAGSGPFTGTVSSNDAIQFTVIPTDNSGYAEIVFTGKIQPDGSMSGTYTLPGTGQGGTWQFKPANP